MGDYNVSCGVSRISLGGGNKCALIPLTRTEHSDEIFDGACYVSNDGPCGRFHPITLPVFGEYNSYGTLENIEEDCNTKAIEKQFGCSIGDFVDHMCSLHHSPIKDTNDKVPKKPFGMFVKREVYDMIAAKPIGEWGEAETAFNDCDLSTFVLRYFGFVEDTTIERNHNERYNRPFKHEKIPNLIIWSDGTWIEIQLDGGKKVNPSIYHPKDLLKFLKKNNLFVPLEKFEALKTMRPGDIEYDKDCEKLLLLMAADSKTLEMKEGMATEELLKVARALVAASEHFCSLRFLKFGNWFDSGKPFRELYGHLLKDSTFKKLMVDYKTFEVQLWHVNAPLMPSWNGIQYGNQKATLRLAKLTQKLCREKIKEYNQNI
jgi:hypothetical protein